MEKIKLYFISIELSEKDTRSILDNLDTKLMCKINSVQEQADRKLSSFEKNFQQKIESAEKDLQNNITSSQSQLEETVKSLLSENNDKLEKINLKLVNERKELELELREENNFDSDNVFINMLKSLGNKIEKATDSTEDFKRTQIENQRLLEQNIDEKQRNMEISIKSNNDVNLSEIENQKKCIRESLNNFFFCKS